MSTQYQTELLMLEHGHMFQINQTGLKIKIIGSKEQKLLKTNYLIRLHGRINKELYR